MRCRTFITRLVLLLLLTLAPLSPSLPAKAGMGRNPDAVPPFDGTIFLDPDIIVAGDPTTFQRAPYAGQGMRTMFDRRVNDWVTVNAYLFNASFSDGLIAEIQVNPEFGSADAAAAEATKYGRVIGQLPHILRTDVQTVWIHRGVHPFGGGNHNILIHTGQSALYVQDGILEETLVHEAAHTSLDAAHATAPGWITAQVADGNFISTYARDNPVREDIAESFLPYLAYRLRPGRISPTLADLFGETMPNRIRYFDQQAFDLRPLLAVPDLVARPDRVTTAPATAVTIAPLTNDLLNSDPLTVTIDTLPTHGDLSLNGTNFVYTSTVGFQGVDSFYYAINTFAESAFAEVVVTVSEASALLFLPVTHGPN
ncbi:MAG: hypothetical protein DYG89_06290 [Caldilinea sp. CFX5]|nr:hypothetical protein [Caldilinea sp. CFX5]